MSADDCLQCSRWFCCVVLVLFNILGGLIGLLLLVLGCVLLWGFAILKQVAGQLMEQIKMAMRDAMGADFDIDTLLNGLSSTLGAAAAVFIVLGIVIIVISCIGCWGACCGVPACLIIYAVSVSVLFIAQLVVVIIWFANNDLLKQTVRSSLEQQVKKFTGYRSSNIESVMLNVMQMGLGCCGVNNGSDFYKLSEKWDRNYTIRDSSNRTFSFNLTYPVTCCKFRNFRIEDPYCPYNGTSEATNINFGCYNKLFATVETYFKLNDFFFGLIGDAALLLLLVLGALLIFFAVRRQQDPERMDAYKPSHLA